MTRLLDGSGRTLVAALLTGTILAGSTVWSGMAVAETATEPLQSCGCWSRTGANRKRGEK